MKRGSHPVVKDLVLIGGGHSHVLVLKNFAMHPVPGVQLTVIARDVETPYSGMLPGYVSGHYNFDDIHIDLRPLCRFASARLVHDSAVSIDTDNKQVICGNRPPLDYDLLSINIGSRPEMASVAGAAEFATPVKPINHFVNRWQQLKNRVLQADKACRIVVVGAGAAGVELLLSVQHRLQQISQLSIKPEFHLVSKTSQLLPTFTTSVGKRFAAILADRGVVTHPGKQVINVDATQIELSDQSILEYDELLWVTGASAPYWLKDSGLAVDKDGFILVNDYLQSTSHSDIFAAGDIVHMVNHPRPKAGVFAVRQGRPLAENLRRVLLNRPLQPYKPQKTLLALISTGDKYAIGSKAGFHLEGAWLWRWKDWIDRRFMHRFNRLPDMPEPETPAAITELLDGKAAQSISSASMRCGGCGSKVGATVLGRVINRLKPVNREDVLVGLQKPDDAAIVQVPAGHVMLHSVDYFRDFIHDPYLFGQIAANHSLSDLFAMGAEVQSALAIATVPFAGEAKTEQILIQLMSGAIKVLNDANAELVGGHSSEGAELALGFSVNGFAHPDKILNKGGMQPDDLLILTKALGTGTLFAADMRQKAKARWIDSAIKSMLLSNRLAADCFYRYGANACTDITGFGLLGHLLEMIQQSSVTVEINLSAIPLLEGAIKTVEMGLLSSLQPDNLRLNRAIRTHADTAGSPVYSLLFDPQTSGGLLASVPADKAEGCLKELVQAGYPEATVIGRVRTDINCDDAVTLVL